MAGKQEAMYGDYKGRDVVQWQVQVFKKEGAHSSHILRLTDFGLSFTNKKS